MFLALITARRNADVVSRDNQSNFHVTKQPKMDLEKLKEADDYTDAKDTSIFGRVHKARNRSTLLKPSHPYLAYQESVLPGIQLEYPKSTLVECCVVAGKRWSELPQNDYDVS